MNILLYSIDLVFLSEVDVLADRWRDTCKETWVLARKFKKGQKCLTFLYRQFIFREIEITFQNSTQFYVKSRKCNINFKNLAVIYAKKSSNGWKIMLFSHICTCLSYAFGFDFTKKMGFAKFREHTVEIPQKHSHVANFPWNHFPNSLLWKWYFFVFRVPVGHSNQNKKWCTDMEDNF